MSYILEALKRSQDERELGRVPTLESAPYLTSEKNVRPGVWVASALVLALLAVGIALYAALVDRPAGATVEADSPSVPPSSTTSLSNPAAREPTPTAPTARTASVDDEPGAVGKGEPRGTTPAPVGADARPRTDVHPTTPPSASATTARPSSLVAPQAGRTVEEPASRSAPAASAPSRVRLPVAPGSAPLPADLLDEIAKFKARVLTDGPDANAGGPEATPGDQVAPGARATSREAAPDTTSEQVPSEPDPTPAFSELPSSRQRQIPEHRLTVHAYGANPAERFVILNSRKMREGERSPEGLSVVEIRPDGIVLEFEGERFFRHR
jgi:general secretion pathway protein B